MTDKMDDMIQSVAAAAVAKIKREKGITYDKWISPREAKRLLGNEQWTNDELRNFLDTHKLNYNYIKERDLIISDFEAIRDYLKTDIQGEG